MLPLPPIPPVTDLAGYRYAGLWRSLGVSLKLSIRDILNFRIRANVTKYIF